MSKLYDIYRQCGGKVITDSRDAKGGELYFALKGDNFDGNSFAVSALEGGASCAVVDNKSIKGENIIVVEDALSELQNLAAEHRQSLGIQIFALTGTNGKTTTKELVKVALEKKFSRVGCTAGNFNNHIGVPLTLLSFNELIEIGVVEMGANHPGEIAKLCEIAEPNVGLITNIGLAHLEGFGSFEGVKSTKAELFNYLKQNRGKAIYNIEDEVVSNLVSDIKVDAIPYRGSMLEDVTLHLFGKYNKRNAAAATATAEYFGVDRIDAIKAVQDYVPTNNRSEIVACTDRSNRLVVDCYNANPSSMTVAINEFMASEGKEGIMILGAMKELGEYSAIEHREIYDLSQSLGNECYYIGLEFKGIAPEDCYFDNVDTAAQKLKLTGSNILLKGSRSIGLERLLTVL